MRTRDLSPITTCSCGAPVARTARVDPDVCPHSPEPALAVSLTGRTSSDLAASIRALEVAAAHLTRPATSCTCPRVLVGDLDPDPDCPGLARGADGCRADGRIRAWSALQHAGLVYSSHSLRLEREVLVAALEHARAYLAHGHTRAALVAAAGVDQVIVAARPTQEERWVA